MSMSTHVYGIRKPDEKWLQMKEVYDVCRKNGVPVPMDVEKFFNWETPDKNGIKINLEDLKLVKKYSPYDGTDRCEIKISDLPENITHICFDNSW